MDFPGGSVVRNLPANARDTGEACFMPGRSVEIRNGNPPQDYCLENPVVRGAWWVTVHGVTKSQTRRSIHTCNNKNNKFCQLSKRLLYS